MMAEKLKLDSEVHDLKLGKSFEPKSKVAFHSIRYDFKPESLDSTKSSTVTIGENNSVTVNVPHVQSSGTSHTIFKGNKRPVQKECVLLIDHDTGEFTLEKLSNAIQLKKTRVEGSSKATASQRPHTPIEQLKKGSKHSKHKKKQQQQQQETTESASRKEPGDSSHNSSQQSRKEQGDSSHTKKEADRVSPVALMEDSSSDSSGSDMDISPPPARTDRFSHLSADLALSDSGSDSD